MLLCQAFFSIFFGFLQKVSLFCKNQQKYKKTAGFSRKTVDIFSAFYYNKRRACFSQVK